MNGGTTTGLILAIDPSLTNTACIVGGTRGFQIKTFQSRLQRDDAAGRVFRYEELAGHIEEWMTHNMESVGNVYIEGYSFASKGSSVIQIAEYGGILRSMLVHHLRVDQIHEVAPSTLKKFATGKGVGPKDMVAANLTKRYGVLLSNNDEFDAYGLYRLGLVAEGLEEAQNQAQRECVDKVLGRSVTKKRKGG